MIDLINKSRRGEPIQQFVSKDNKMGKAKKIVDESEEEQPVSEEELDEDDNDDEEAFSEEDHDDQSEEYEEEESVKKPTKKSTPQKIAAKTAAKSPNKPAKAKRPMRKASGSKSKPIAKSNNVAKSGASGNKQNKDEKKKHFLPGQKFQTPDEEDGARAFYTSLYHQNQKSQMAKRYCLDYGLLEKEEANKIIKQLSKKK